MRKIMWTGAILLIPQCMLLLYNLIDKVVKEHAFDLFDLIILMSVSLLGLFIWSTIRWLLKTRRVQRDAGKLSELH